MKFGIPMITETVRNNTLHDENITKRRQEFSFPEFLYDWLLFSVSYLNKISGLETQFSIQSLSKQKFVTAFSRLTVIGATHHRIKRSQKYPKFKSGRWRHHSSGASLVRTLIYHNFCRALLGYNVLQPSLLKIIIGQNHHLSEFTVSFGSLCC